MSIPVCAANCSGQTRGPHVRPRRTALRFGGGPPDRPRWRHRRPPPGLLWPLRPAWPFMRALRTSGRAAWMIAARQASLVATAELPPARSAARQGAPTGWRGPSCLASRFRPRPASPARPPPPSRALSGEAKVKAARSSGRPGARACAAEQAAQQAGSGQLRLRPRRAGIRCSGRHRAHRPTARRGPSPCRGTALAGRRPHRSKASIRPPRSTAPAVSLPAPGSAVAGLLGVRGHHLCT